MGMDKHNVRKNEGSKVSTAELKNKPKRTKEFLEIYLNWVAKEL
jgi:hypothetical protein